MLGFNSQLWAVQRRLLLLAMSKESRFQLCPPGVAYQKLLLIFKCREYLCATLEGPISSTNSTDTFILYAIVYFVAKLFKIIYDFTLWPILQYLSHQYSPRFEGPCHVSPKYKSSITYILLHSNNNATQDVDKQLLFGFYINFIYLGWELNVALVAVVGFELHTH